MNKNIDLKEIEKKAFTSYHQDGLLDIFLGLGILGFAFTLFFDMGPITGILPALAIILYTGFKKIITTPRIGYVKLNSKWPRYLVLTWLIAFVVFVVAGLFVAIFAWKSSGSGEMPHWILFLLRQYPKITLAIAGGFLFAILAYLLALNSILLVRCIDDVSLLRRSYTGVCGAIPSFDSEPPHNEYRRSRTHNFCKEISKESDSRLRW